MTSKFHKRSSFNMLQYDTINLRDRKSLNDYHLLKYINCTAILVRVLRKFGSIFSDIFIIPNISTIYFLVIHSTF